MPKIIRIDKIETREAEMEDFDKAIDLLVSSCDLPTDSLTATSIKQELTKSGRARSLRKVNVTPDGSVFHYYDVPTNLIGIFNALLQISFAELPKFRELAGEVLPARFSLGDIVRAGEEGAERKRKQILDEPWWRRLLKRF